MAKQQYGGQAVIEGVMMRGPDAFALAVRKPDGSIAVLKEAAPQISKRYKLAALPVFRGAFVFVDSMLLGVRSLMLSAELSGTEEEKMSSTAQFFAMLTAVLFSVALFIVLPTVLMSLLKKHVNAPVVLLNLFEGILRSLIFVAYVALVARMEEVRRVLQYHGAEHKVINTYDAGERLEVESVLSHSRLHLRCGTSFLLFVMVIGSVLFSFFGWPGVVRRVVLRLSLLPLVAGLSYEIIRYSSRSRSWLVRALAAPGLWLQRMTTLEPDSGQVEVAIESLKALVAED